MRAAGATVMIDNVFATPMSQHPLQLGADVVIYSATKHIDGQGRVMGGAVLASEEFISERMLKFYRQTGPTITPFNAWVMLKSLETLGLRVDRQASNAARLANWLEGHGRQQCSLSRARQPPPARPDASDGKWWHLLAFTLMAPGHSLFCTEFSSAIDISNNLGDSKTLACHPASTTHSSVDAADRDEMGIGASSIRLSVGLEDVDDLIEDLAQALEQAVR